MGGLPREVVLDPEEIREAIEAPISVIIDAIKQALTETPPDLAQDLLELGIHLVGGTAMLRGLPERIEYETGVPVRLADLPLETVVLGAADAWSLSIACGRCLWIAPAVRAIAELLGRYCFILWLLAAKFPPLDALGGHGLGWRLQ